VVAAVDAAQLQDDGHTALSAEVRDEDYEPVPDAVVEAHVLGPDGLSARVPLTPVNGAPGRFRAEWNAQRSGDYLTEITATRAASGAARAGPLLGRDVLSFRRVDGAAENFHTAQDRMPALLLLILALAGGEWLLRRQWGII
jgi:hypothetical protein